MQFSQLPAANHFNLQDHNYILSLYCLAIQLKQYESVLNKCFIDTTESTYGHLLYFSFVEIGQKYYTVL